MRAKHTPGPWKRCGFYVANTDSTVVANSRPDDGNGIVRVRDEHEAVANARLIAAAPDLLAACENVLRWAEAASDTLRLYAEPMRWDGGRAARNMGPFDQPMITAARAAIRKARGE